MSGRFLVHYEVTCQSPSEIESLARGIALEQTIEAPEDCITTEFIRTEIVGRVESLSPLAGPGHRYAVSISYSGAITAYQVPQFLNVLFGNISLKNHIRIVGLDLPETFARIARGPNFGVAGIRRWLGVYGRPLAATALKPMGTPPAQLAAIAKAFALAGGDIVKDDHGLADHEFGSFRERVERCQAAVQEAAALTGHPTLYFPNVIGSTGQMEEQIEFARSRGVQGVLLSPLLVGPDQLRHLSAKYNLAFMAHPAFTGTHFHDRNHGMAPAVLLGTLFRWLGADISVFPNSGGRFGFSAGECQALAQALKRPWHGWNPAFPAPAGGMKLNSIQRLASEYGEDAVYLIGGALLQHAGGVEAGTRLFMESIRGHFQEKLEKPVPDV